jgi:hypothetical protein
MSAAVASLVMSLVASPSIQSGGGPRMPWLDWGACPFECCTYRKWTATAPLRILKSRQRDAPVAFKLKQGEEIEGLTGVVITTRVGEARIFRPSELGKQRLTVVPGDTVYILHYEGEGYSKFWFRGRIDSEQIPDIEDSAPDSELDLRIVRRPETTWWVKVKNSSGQVGWTDDTEHLDHKDACE